MQPNISVVTLAFGPVRPRPSGIRRMAICWAWSISPDLHALSTRRIWLLPWRLDPKLRARLRGQLMAIMKDCSDTFYRSVRSGRMNILSRSITAGRLFMAERADYAIWRGIIPAWHPADVFRP